MPVICTVLLFLLLIENNKRTCEKMKDDRSFFQRDENHRRPSLFLRVQKAQAKSERKH